MSHSHDEQSLRHHLRRSTAPNHARAEAVYWTGSDFHGRAGYERYLRALQQAHLVWGCRAADILDQPGESARHAWLAALLAQDCGDTSVTPEHIALPQPMSQDEAWGTTYALVGSALGASMILRKLSHNHDWPMGYLRAAQAHAASGGVLRIFDALDASGADRDAAHRGACALFRLIETHGAQPMAVPLAAAAGF